MLSELGMREEVDKEGLLRMAGDIEAGGSEELERQCDRGRRLLRYMKDHDRLVRCEPQQIC